jgi:hypothetical protein
MSPVLKVELLAVLNGTSQLAVTLDEDDRASLEWWAREWIDGTHDDDREYESLWQEIESDARMRGTCPSDAAAIFQSLIWYTVEARHIAKSVEPGGDPALREERNRREYLLQLAAKADALAKYCSDSQQYSGISVEFWYELMYPLLQQLKLRLIAEDRCISVLELPLPAYELPMSVHLLQELHEREAELLRRQAGEEPTATTYVSRERQHRARNAFVHKITDYLHDLCGTNADGKPHRKAIATLVKINFPDEDMDEEDVRKTLARRGR